MSTALVDPYEDVALDGSSFSSCSYPGCVHGAELPRNQWGQPTGPFGRDGAAAAVPRISTVAKEVSGGSSTPLMGWAVRRALIGITRDRGLRDAVSVAVSRGDPDSDEMRALATRAQDLGGSAQASAAGTALHEVVLGGLVGAPVEFADEAASASYIAAADTLDAAGLEVILTEQFVVAHTEDGDACGGSYDALVRRRATGSFHVLDVKTSAKQNDRAYPGPVSVQVAAYSRGRRYCPVHGWLRDPPVDAHLGYLLSVPLDGGIALLDELDLDVGYRGLQHAFALRAWRREKPLYTAR